MADSVNMEKITVGTTAINLYEELKSLYNVDFLGQLDKKAGQPIKAVIVKNYTEGSIIYLGCFGKTATTGGGYPLGYSESMSFTESQLDDITIISNTAGTDVRWFIV